MQAYVLVHPCLIIFAFVQALAFVNKSSVCTGARAGACVPPSVFENHARGMSRDQCGTTLGQFWDDLQSVLEHFASTGHHFGTMGHQL